MTNPPTYISKFVDLRDAGVPRGQLLRALQDGELIAEGILTTGSQDWKSTSDERFFFERLVAKVTPPKAVGREWWLNISLTVELHWSANAMTREISGEVQLMQHIRILAADLRRIWPQESEGPSEASTVKPKTRLPGRPPKWNWESALIEMGRIAHDEGVPNIQNEMVRKLQDWFASQGGDSPAESEVKLRVSKFYKSLGR